MLRQIYTNPNFGFRECAAHENGILLTTLDAEDVGATN
jgi:hypothetical protein